MKTRCYRPSYHQYHDYGGRGIRVCDEWRDNFKAFHDWAMANGYSKDLTLDRRDNDGNYTPDNCRWATRNEQQKNRRMPIIRNRGIGGRKERQITVGNETHSFVEWSNLTGIPRKTIKSRYYRGIRDNDLIALTPRQKQRANASPTKVER